MPTMQEIYQAHSTEYDELVCNEDYECNLYKALHSIVDFSEKAVLELGVGTGRVTRAYADRAREILCCDVSEHMLERARNNLARWQSKISTRRESSLELSLTSIRYDIVIEGWSFGHLIPDIDQDIARTTNQLLLSCRKNLLPKGTIIIIETLGTNVDKPFPPKERLGKFYDLLEMEHGFEKNVISTDYRFSTNEEASRVMGFFFGDSMKESVSMRGGRIIPEFTGIWYKRGL